MSAITEDIKTMLVSELGYVFADNLHIGKQPDEPSNCVTLYDTGNSPIPDLCKDIVESGSIQIRVRGNDYPTGSSSAQEIVDQLNARSNETINGNFYLSIIVANGPVLLEYDHKNRVQFVINLEILRRN